MSSRPRATYTEVGACAITTAVTVSDLSLVVTDVETPTASSVDAQLILRAVSRRAEPLLPAPDARLCWPLAAAAVAKSGGEATLLLCAESTSGCFRWIMAGAGRAS